MKRILAALLVVVATASLMTVTPAEAKRLGGGSSLGMKRAAPAPAAPASAPAAAPTQAGAAAPAAPAPAAPSPASGFSRWLGPLAGLGIGAGLMAMFGGGAMGGAIGSMFAMLALAAVGFFLFQMFRRKSQSAPVTSAPTMHYAGATPVETPRTTTVSPVAEFPVTAGPTTATTVAAVAPEAPRYPQGFDAEEFVRQAKISFIRLQAANDTKDLRDLRDFTTPELYAELAMQIQERDAAPQRTEVVTLNAELLEAATEQERIIASVRYSGMIREDAASGALPFSETWHVVKDLKHPTPTWHIAGIQQAS